MREHLDLASAAAMTCLTGLCSSHQVRFPLVALRYAHRPTVFRRRTLKSARAVPSDVLPYAADVGESLPEAELQVLRQQYNDEEAKGHLSVQTRFNLAWGLVKAARKEQTGEGVIILMDIYREEPSRRRECLYYLALGNYKLGNFDEARRYNSLLLDREPSNLQAKSLAELIEKDVSREGYLGMAILGGAVAVASALTFAFMKTGDRR